MISTDTTQYRHVEVLVNHRSKRKGCGEQGKVLLYAVG